MRRDGDAEVRREAVMHPAVPPERSVNVSSFGDAHLTACDNYVELVEIVWKALVQRHCDEISIAVDR